MRLIASLTLTLAAAVALAGCTFENTSEGQTASASGDGSFSTAGNLGMGDGTKTVRWDNPHEKASYTVSANLGGGSITFEFKDADGKPVHSVTMSKIGQSSRSATTNAGAPGEWTVLVKANGASGQYQISGRGSA